MRPYVMMPQESFTQRSASDQPFLPDGDVFDQIYGTRQPADLSPILGMEETLTVGRGVIETGRVRMVEAVNQDQQATQEIFIDRGR